MGLCAQGLAIGQDGVLEEPLGVAGVALFLEPSGGIGLAHESYLRQGKFTGQPGVLADRRSR